VARCRHHRRGDRVHELTSHLRSLSSFSCYPWFFWIIWERRGCTGRFFWEWERKRERENREHNYR